MRYRTFALAAMLLFVGACTEPVIEPQVEGPQLAMSSSDWNTVRSKLDQAKTAMNYARQESAYSIDAHASVDGWWDNIDPGVQAAYNAISSARTWAGSNNEDQVMNYLDVFVAQNYLGYMRGMFENLTTGYEGGLSGWSWQVNGTMADFLDDRDEPSGQIKHSVEDELQSANLSRYQASWILDDYQPNISLAVGHLTDAKNFLQHYQPCWYYQNSYRCDALGSLYDGLVYHASQYPANAGPHQMMFNSHNILYETWLTYGYVIDVLNLIEQGGSGGGGGGCDPFC